MSTKHGGANARVSAWVLRWICQGTAIGLLVACQALPDKPSQKEQPGIVAIPEVALQITPEMKPLSGSLDVPPPPRAAAQQAVPTRDLWDRIRSGFTIASLGGNAARLQAVHEKWYRDRPEHLERVFKRSKPYLFDIVEATEQSGLPMEVALLPAVESAFMPHATSTAAADGLWQFIAPTARRYDLKVHLFLDQRRDVRAATRAALRYLQSLRARYGGDMQLALAAYNCGEGCIDAHIRRAKARGLQGRFEDLDLNRETANYVPRLLALTTLVAEAFDNQRMERLGLPPLQNTPYFSAVAIRRDVDVTRAAELSGLTLQEFRNLNPQHKRPVIVADAQQEVLVPIARADAFTEALQNNRGPLSTWTTVLVKKPTLPSALARSHGSSVALLQEVNGIKPGYLIKPGSTVLVPRSGPKGEITLAVAEAAVLHTEPIIVSIKVAVRKGENWKRLVARMNANGYRVTTGLLKTHNPKLRLKPGNMTLRLPATAQPS